MWAGNTNCSSKFTDSSTTNTTPQGTSLNNLQAHTHSQNVALQQQSLLPQPQFPNPNAIPAQPQFTHPHVTPQASPIRQQSPIRMQTNLFSQHSIPAPEATVPGTPEQRIPKSINGEGVKNSRKQGTAPTSNAPDGKLCFPCKYPGHLKKDCAELPYCSKCKTQGHIPVKCPTKQQNSRHRMKGAKVPTKDMKLTEKIGRKHRTNLSSLTKATNALTVQVITGPTIV